MKKTFKINGRKVTIYSRNYSRKPKEKPLTKKKKAEYGLYAGLFAIMILAGGLIMFVSMILFAFHDIDLAYNSKDYPIILNHYNLFNNESRTANELYSQGWGQIFYIILIYNIFCLCLMAWFIDNLTVKYHKFKKRFR